MFKVVYNIILVTLLIGSHEAISAEKAPVQDLEMAKAYFQKELEFKINPTGLELLRTENSGLEQLRTEKMKFIIVDVRLAKDFKEGHIKGAINIPFDEHQFFRGPETEFKGLSRDDYNYIYCYEAGCPFGPMSAIKFASCGYPVKEIVGGWEAWTRRGLPTEK